MATQIATPKEIKNYDYGEFWGNIWQEVHSRDGIVTIVFCGKRGRGKSRSMCQLARVLDCSPNGVSRFRPEEINFDILSFMKALTGKYKRGKVIMLDDAGLHMYKSDALTTVLKNVSKILQGIRYKHPIIMMSLPYYEQLVKDARSMSDVYIEMVAIDRDRKRARGKIQILKISPFTSDLYRFGLKKKVVEENKLSGVEMQHWADMLFDFQKPDKEFDAEYSRIKKMEMNKVNERIIEETSGQLSDNEAARKRRMPFSDAVEYVKNHLEEVKNKKGAVAYAKVMLLKDENGNELFTAGRAREIVGALQ